MCDLVGTENKQHFVSYCPLYWELCVLLFNEIKNMTDDGEYEWFTTKIAVKKESFKLASLK